MCVRSCVLRPCVRSSRSIWIPFWTGFVFIKVVKYKKGDQKRIKSGHLTKLNQFWTGFVFLKDRAHSPHRPCRTRLPPQFDLGVSLRASWVVPNELEVTCKHSKSFLSDLRCFRKNYTLFVDWKASWPPYLRELLWASRTTPLLSSEAEIQQLIRNMA